MALTPEQEQIKADFVAARGDGAWNEAWDATLRIDPSVKDLFAFRFEHFTLESYDPHPHIKASVSV